MIDKPASDTNNRFAGKKYRLHNRMTGDSLGPFTWQELTELAHSGDIGLENRIAELEKPDLWVKIADTPLVFELPLCVENHQYEPVEKKTFRFSHRMKDYFKLWVTGNLAIVCLGLLVAINPMSLVFLLALFVIYNTAPVWILFFIMSPY